MNTESKVTGYWPAYSATPDNAIMFTAYGEPMSKQRPRFNPKSGRAYTPKQTRNAEQEIAEAYKTRTPFMFDCPVGVEIQFFLGTKRRKDIDNLVKTVLDGLNGVAFTDDHFVHVLSAQKFFSTPDKARTEIRIVQITETDGA